MNNLPLRVRSDTLKPKAEEPGVVNLSERQSEVE